MSALICGSFAFDTIMVFNDQFKKHIIPEKVHILNVSFMVPHLRREFGGCAGNIAYNFELLGGVGKPMGVVGHDFGPYAAWMDKTNVSREYITEIKDQYTAQAYITTDLDDNQITAFHPGAMDFSYENRVPADSGIKLGIVSPDGRRGMIEHAEQFATANIPFIFDPGQGMPMFNGEELMKFIGHARWLTLNDYESQLMQEKTGLSLGDIAKHVDAVIVTYGGSGSMILTTKERLDIPAVKPTVMKDPTGCGDAYRAGLLYGLQNEFDWPTTGRIAALMGASKIEQEGTQNHHFNKPEFEERFFENFGYRF